MSSGSAKSVSSISESESEIGSDCITSLGCDTIPATLTFRISNSTCGLPNGDYPLVYDPVDDRWETTVACAGGGSETFYMECIDSFGWDMGSSCGFNEVATIGQFQCDPFAITKQTSVDLAGCCDCDADSIDWEVFA